MNFAVNFGVRNLEFRGYRVALFDRHADRQTHRHTTTAYTALSIALRGKNEICCRITLEEFIRKVRGESISTFHEDMPSRVFDLEAVQILWKWLIVI